MTDFKALADELLLVLRNNSRLRYRRDINVFSNGELSILAYLKENENGVFAGVLCKELGMTTPRISAAISSLQNKEFVFRVVDTVDRRRVRVFITDTGLQLIEQKKAELLILMENILLRLGENDAKEYVRLTKRINDITSNE